MISDTLKSTMIEQFYWRSPRAHCSLSSFSDALR